MAACTLQHIQHIKTFLPARTQRTTSLAFVSGAHLEVDRGSDALGTRSNPISKLENTYLSVLIAF